MITSILSTDLASALAWTIIHSLWQLSLVAFLLAIILKWAKNADATHRYLISFGALGISLVTSIVTFTIYYAESITLSEGVITSLQNQSYISPTVSYQTIPGVLSTINEYSSIIVDLWMVGALLFVFKFLGGFLYLRKLINEAKLENTILGQSVARLSTFYKINRKVDIKESQEIDTPMVVGFFKPIILFPLGLVNQLSIQEVEAILAHELAHIKRHDYLFNFIQIFAEVLFYFHPAIWYISSRIRIERENCCDDMAIGLSGNSISYAKTLLKLQELKTGQFLPSMAFSGHASNFSKRILRILQEPGSNNFFKDKLMVGALIVSSLFMGADNIDKHNTPAEEEDYDVYVIDDCPQSPEDIKYYLDTIPERNSFHIKKKTNDKELELEMENGEITKLKIDGKEVDKKDYDKHENIIIELSPDKDKSIITLFPDCGEDFGNIYFLGKNGAEAINMDSILEDMNTKLELRLEDIDNDFEFETFDFAWKDSIQNKFKDFDFDYNFDGNIFIDTFKHLFPENFESPNIFFYPDRDDIEEDVIIKLKDELKSFPNKWMQLYGEDDGSSIIIEKLKERDRDDEDISIFEFHDGNKSKYLFPQNGFEFYFDSKELEENIRDQQKDLEFYFEGGSRMKASDYISKHLLEDRLISNNEISKIELSGKHLKINGDKQPKNLWRKYKEIYEEHTGITLDKGSKIKFEVNPKEKKRFKRSI